MKVGTLRVLSNPVVAVARNERRIIAAPDLTNIRAPLVFVLVAALAVRLWIVSTHTYLVFPDETFQYLEPAHRLLFGSGVITWEFLDGGRSWLLSGIVAAIMWIVSLVDSDPAAYIPTLRILCVIASLSVPYVGFQLTARRLGTAPALFTGLLCAFASEAIYFAPSIMTEPLATDAALLAVWLGDSALDRPVAWRQLLIAGLLFGLATSLRYQYGPVLGAVALFQHARQPRRFAIVAAGGIATVALLSGVLDMLTWGAPFHAAWQNFQLNATQGIAGAMSSEPPSYYLSYYAAAWGAAALALLACVILGGARLPVVAIIVICTIGLHSLTPHKELRFVFLATACVPILLGGGLSIGFQQLSRRHPTMGIVIAATLALAVAACLAIITYNDATRPDAWHRDRSLLQATAAAREYPDACGLAIRRVWVYRTGGYTYWHRPLPIYFESWDEAQHLETSTYLLRLDSVLDGRSVPQFPGETLAANTNKFNVMIGRPADILPGFSEFRRFGRGTRDDPATSVFIRPGGCE